MIKRITLISLVLVMALGAVAIGRYPRKTWRSILPVSRPAGANRVLFLTDIKTDMLIPAGSAPAAPEFAEGIWINSEPDRKSTRLNSSHSQISYAVFCLKKKKKTRHVRCTRRENRRS